MKAVFSFGTVKLSTLELDKFLPREENPLVVYVIHPLGNGDFGDCCLGVGNNGASCCAIKFFHHLSSYSSTKQAEDERMNWNKVYGDIEEIPKCFTWKIAGQEACLVMPYLQPVPANERLSLLDDGTIRQTLKQFAKSGFTHSDVKWRHFGWFGKQLFMSDLSSIEKSSTGGDVSSWLEACLASLEKSSGTSRQNITPNRRNEPQSGGKRKSSLAGLADDGSNRSPEQV